MAHNGDRIPRPRRPGELPRTPAAVPPHTSPAPVPSGTDEVATVYAWLRRCVPEPAVADDLLVEVFRRSRTPGPDCLRAAPPGTRLRYLTVQSVLRSRGVL